MGTAFTESAGIQAWKQAHDCGTASGVPLLRV